MFSPRKATEINRKPRNGPGGSTLYLELARAVAELDVGYSIAVTPDMLGKENDMSDDDEAGKFRSGIATAMKRHVVDKFGLRLRTTLDADGCVQVERLADKTATAPVEAPQEDDTDGEEEFGG